MPDHPPQPPPVPPSAEPDASAPPGERVDDGKGRIFPCPSCGADLEFNIGAQKLKCPYCSHVIDLEFKQDSTVAEQDFGAMLARLADQRKLGRSEQMQATELRCASCGANVLFTDTLTSTECPYCGSPIQREHVHDAQDRVPVDGVLPFLVERHVADQNLKDWVRSRWFAPNEFLQRGVNGKFNGVYLPFWTFDSVTVNHYAGQRGEYYYVTVGSGKNRHTVRRTRWYPAGGSFQRFFDDVLVTASTGLSPDLMESLTPWPLARCLPFSQQLLAGYFARTYETPLDRGFEEARERIAKQIYADVCGRIGGDTQIVSSINTRHLSITYKHLLLPVWLLAYRFREKSYQLAVNAATGEVCGQRPYSWIKITLTVLATAAVIGAIVLITSQFQ